MINKKSMFAVLFLIATLFIYNTTDVETTLAYDTIKLVDVNVTSIGLSAKPITFQNGKWTYQFTWSRVRDAQGTFFVTLKSNPTTIVLKVDPASRNNSSNPTSAVLDPSTEYLVEYYNLPECTRGDVDCVVIASKSFTTLGAGAVDTGGSTLSSLQAQIDQLMAIIRSLTTAGNSTSGGATGGANTGTNNTGSSVSPNIPSLTLSSGANQTELAAAINSQFDKPQVIVDNGDINITATIIDLGANGTISGKSNYPGRPASTQIVTGHSFEELTDTTKTLIDYGDWYWTYKIKWHRKTDNVWGLNFFDEDAKAVTTPPTPPIDPMPTFTRIPGGPALSFIPIRVELQKPASSHNGFQVQKFDDGEKTILVRAGTSFQVEMRGAFEFAPPGSTPGTTTTNEIDMKAGGAQLLATSPAVPTPSLSAKPKDVPPDVAMCQSQVAKYKKFEPTNGASPRFNVASKVDMVKNFERCHYHSNMGLQVDSQGRKVLTMSLEEQRRNAQHCIDLAQNQGPQLGFEVSCSMGEYCSQSDANPTGNCGDSSTYPVGKPFNDGYSGREVVCTVGVGDTKHTNIPAHNLVGNDYGPSHFDAAHSMWLELMNELNSSIASKSMPKYAKSKFPGAFLDLTKGVYRNFNNPTDYLTFNPPACMGYINVAVTKMGDNKAKVTWQAPTSVKNVSIYLLEDAPFIDTSNNLSSTIAPKMVKTLDNAGETGGAGNNVYVGMTTGTEVSASAKKTANYNSKGIFNYPAKYKDFGGRDLSGNWSWDGQFTFTGTEATTSGVAVSATVAENVANNTGTNNFEFTIPFNKYPGSNYRVGSSIDQMVAAENLKNKYFVRVVADNGLFGDSKRLGLSGAFDEFDYGTQSNPPSDSIMQVLTPSCTLPPSINVGNASCNNITSHSYNVGLFANTSWYAGIWDNARMVLRVSKNQSDVMNGCGPNTSCALKVDDVWHNPGYLQGSGEMFQNTANAGFMVESLEPSTTYYFRTAAVCDYGSPSQKYTDEVWSCTTKPATEVQPNGKSCVNECNLGQSRCSLQAANSKVRQLCGNYDDDACYEYSNLGTNGSYISDPSCTAYVRQCGGDGESVCPTNTNEYANACPMDIRLGNVGGMCKPVCGGAGQVACYVGGDYSCPNSSFGYDYNTKVCKTSATSSTPLPAGCQTGDAFSRTTGLRCS